MSFELNGRPKILILTGNLGDGHRQAAYAIAEAAVRLDPRAETRVVDVMEKTHPRLHRISQFLYMQWITRFPGIYGFLFRLTKEDNLFSRLFKKFPLCSLSRLAKLLEEMEPTVVVCTFPAAAAAISRLKTGRITSVPAITVITDHTYHSYWIHPGTDLYITGSEHVREALRKWPVPDRKIAITGIPVRPAFSKPLNKGQLCARHGLDPSLPTIMIMGGGYGLIGGDWAGLLTDPELIRKPMQVIIVCGRNDKLVNRLALKLKNYPHRLILTGYVEHVHELMAVSDLLITKPGGLTTTEALVSELPLLLYKPLPGQEYDNAAFLTKSGAAVQAGNSEEFLRQLVRLLDEPGILAQMKARARQLGRRDSAMLAMRHIFKTAHHTPVEQAPIRHTVYAKA